MSIDLLRRDTAPKTAAPDVVVWLSTAHVARRLGCSQSDVGYLIRTGKLAAVRKGRLYRVREDEFARYLGDETAHHPGQGGPHPLVQQLTHIRRQKGINQDIIADLAGVSWRALQHWEHGTTDVKLRHFTAWAEALGYEVVLRKKER